jgi:hypothetical protein
MNPTILSLLDWAQGPLFRATLAILVLGTLRHWILSLSDTAAAYIALRGSPEFWRKLRQRGAWHLTPTLILKQVYPVSRLRFVYHAMLCLLSLILRLGVIIIPTFMVAHVYLWERGLHVSWPALPGAVTDIGAVITILAGFILFFGRLYSPLLRQIEPPWTFVKPLILIAPFLTGYLVMHPQLSPLSWHFVMLVHVVSACLVFVMVPFGGLLTCMHRPLTDIMPQAAWLGNSAPAATEPEPEIASGGIA